MPREDDIVGSRGLKWQIIRSRNARYIHVFSAAKHHRPTLKRTNYLLNLRFVMLLGVSIFFINDISPNIFIAIFDSISQYFFIHA